MNLNYVGSVAERFMKFSSTVSGTEESTTDIFSAISIYMPKSLAAANLATDSYSADAITADKYGVITVTADNYGSVFSAGGNLSSQWAKVFNDGANIALNMYIVIFDDTGFAVDTTSGIKWAPLTKAFNDLYFISYWKVMFSNYYTGETGLTEEGGTYKDDYYFDMALCLSALCENESTLSFCLTEVKANLSDDTKNVCKVTTLSLSDEKTFAASGFTGTTAANRAKYFWGFLNFLGGAHTELHIQSTGNGEIYMLPVIFSKWFETPNSSGTYIGNKLAKIRLSASGVMPTGTPSPLNSAVNVNLSSDVYDILDEKKVGYFISIADGSNSDAEFIRDRSIANYPMTAYAIAKCINYNASQALAKYATAISTLTTPVLANEATYQNIQSLVQEEINAFSGTGRISNVVLSFPAYADAKQGNSFVGTAAWSAVYVDDLEAVTVSGSISF